MVSGVSRGLQAVVLALLLVSIAPRALAQSDDERAGARAAATEGLKALREKRWAEAVDLFTRAESLVHAPPHQLYLAQAQSELGLLVQARENLLRVMRESLAANAPRAFRDAQEEARELLQKLEARLPYVTINVEGGGSARVAVTEDGRRIPDALVGVPRPVNPGSHSYEAVAEGLRGTANLEIKESARERVLVKLEPANVAAPPAASAAAGESGNAASEPGAAGSQGPSTAAEIDTAAGGTNPLRIASYVALGVGVVGLGLGTFFALDASGKFDESNTLFEESNCAQSCSETVKAQISQLDSDGDSAQSLAIVGFVAGGVGVAAGVVLFIVSGKDTSTPAEAVRLRPYVGLASAGVVGSF
jgi:hypothetical protein